MAVDPTRRGLIGAGLGGVVGGSAPARDGRSAGPERLFDPRDFGATGRPDGDDTPAFIAMHRAMIRMQREDDLRLDPFADRPDFVIRLAPGTYRYAWNRWTWGLRRVSVFGYGAALQCIHPGPFDMDQAPLWSNRDHYWSFGPYDRAFSGPGPAEDYGVLIESTAPGDRFVRTKGEPPRLAPSEWVLIQSLAQQLDGYPPNMRRHDRARVVSVEGRTIRLDRPLRHAHLEDAPELPDFPLAPGRARLVKIDRPDCPLAETQLFAGLTVLSNPNHARLDRTVRETVEVFNVCGVIDATLRDCRFIAFGVSQADTVAVENCRIGYTEPDKLLNRLVFERCRIRSIQQGTGVEHLVLRNCTLEETAQLLAREVDVEECDLLGASHPAGSRRAINLAGTAPTRRMRLVRNRFYGGGREGETALGGETGESFDVDGVAVRPVPGGLAVAGGSRAHRLLVELAEEGTELSVEKTGRKLRCRALRGTPEGLILLLDEPAQIAVPTRIFIPRLNRLLMTDNVFVAIGSEAPAVPRLERRD